MKTYTIKEISELFQMPSSTLRYYEEIGLLTNVSRTSSGQRIYQECHINRLKTLCCFKRTGMTISQLLTFFDYEEKETEHIDDILSLLTNQKQTTWEQLVKLQSDYQHIQRKLSYFSDIKTAKETHTSMPQWKDYRNRTYDIFK